MSAARFLLPRECVPELVRERALVALTHDCDVCSARRRETRERVRASVACVAATRQTALLRHRKSVRRIRLSRSKLCPIDLRFGGTLFLLPFLHGGK
jgi:hypothetical protein